MYCSEDLVVLGMWYCDGDAIDDRRNFGCVFSARGAEEADARKQSFTRLITLPETSAIPPRRRSVPVW